MQGIPFSKWNPSGNTTVFFPLGQSLSPECVAQALLPGALCAEQAGFVGREGRLQMAGGEFCVNATRCLGAWLAREAEAQGDRRDRYDFSVQISGWPGRLGLEVLPRGTAWQVSVHLPLPPCRQERLADGVLVVPVPGITHVLLDENSLARPADVLAHARDLLARTGLDREEASGVIWWRRDGAGLSIRPIVHVRDVGTLVEESSCGSGTLALALGLHALSGERDLVVRQPSGDSLGVRLTKDGDGLHAVVTGMVELVCEGLWYPQK